MRPLLLCFFIITYMKQKHTLLIHIAFKAFFGALRAYLFH